MVFLKDPTQVFFVRVLLIAAVGGRTGLAAIAGPESAQPVQRSVLGPGRIITGHITDISARRSQFVVRDADPAHGAFEQVYEIGARVIVDGDIVAVRRAIGPGLSVRQSSTPGFVLVDTPTIDQAIELAHTLAQLPVFGSVEIDLQSPRSDRVPTDPAFVTQWTLRNFASPNTDVNAVSAWNLGYTGTGVTVGVIELGWQADHPDLAANFIAEASMPPSLVTAHATSVAGVIAADNDNGQGGVGIAYDAGLSRQIFGLASDTAAAFLFRNDLNDIKNNSWGPNDNGRITLMSSIERAAIEESTASGRGGLGEILVWAAGNGGLDDRLDYDPYASSRYTIAIGAIGDENRRADYNELGSSMFAVTYSSGNVRSVFSTSSNSSYTSSFGGTSAAAPLAAGMIALMLEANPDLTWRDVQHIIADTAWQVDPDAESWAINADGRLVSEDYGFGAMNALALVQAAESWMPVADEVIANSGLIAVNQTLVDNDPTGVTIAVPMVDAVQLESVELRLNVNTTFVGDLQIVLQSPGGTQSILSMPRVDPMDNLMDHVFTSVRCWGENSAGTWLVNISDRRATNIAEWIDARIVGYGTPWENDCAADLDGNGLTNFVDVQTFLTGYYAHDPVADFTDDGLYDYFDLQAFLNLFAAGCP